MDKMGLGELLPSVPQAQVDESCKIRGSRPTDGLALVYSGTGDCGQARLKGDRERWSLHPKRTNVPGKQPRGPAADDSGDEAHREAGASEEPGIPGWLSE